MSEAAVKTQKDVEEATRAQFNRIIFREENLTRLGMVRGYDYLVPVKKALEKWYVAINDGAAEDVVECYHERAAVKAAFQPDWMFTQEERLAYFTRLKTENKKTSVAISECKLITSGFGHANAIGMYAFTSENDHTKRTVRADFTIGLTRQSDKLWLITTHHSSLVCRPDNGLHPIQRVQDWIRAAGGILNHAATAVRYHRTRVSPPSHPDA